MNCGPLCSLRWALQLGDKSLGLHKRSNTKWCSLLNGAIELNYGDPNAQPAGSPVAQKVGWTHVQPWAHIQMSPILHGHPWPTSPTTHTLLFLYLFIYSNYSSLTSRCNFPFVLTSKFNFQNPHFQSLISQFFFKKKIWFSRFPFSNNFQILNFQS